MTPDIDNIKALLDAGELGKAWHDLGELLKHHETPHPSAGGAHTLDAGGGGSTTNPPPPLKPSDG